MLKLPVRTWILNAAAVFSGRHGAVTRRAEQAGCSRQTASQHAQKLEQRRDFASVPKAPEGLATIFHFRRKSHVPQER